MIAALRIEKDGAESKQMCKNGCYEGKQSRSRLRQGAWEGLSEGPFKLRPE